MANDRIVGSPLPGEHLPYLELMKPGPGVGGAIQGWIASEAIIGIATHFNNRRTIPCTKTLGFCEGCSVWRRRPEWNGYLGVVEYHSKDKVVFGITKGAVDKWHSKTTEGTVLRGAFLRLQRKGNDDPNGAVTMTLRQEPFRGRLPEPPKVIESLARLWRMSVDDLRLAIGWKEGVQA